MSDRGDRRCRCRSDDDHIGAGVDGDRLALVIDVDRDRDLRRGIADLERVRRPRDEGVDNSVASFTVPFGATINMDGTAIMQGVATVFIANAYGVDLGLSGYLTVIMMSVLASIGTAGVPGVGLIMLSMVFTQVGLPVEGIGLILGVDRLLDMIRTAVNVSGDATVSVIVAKNEGKFDRAVYDDPKAGILTADDIRVDEKSEESLAKVIQKVHKKD